MTSRDDDLEAELLALGEALDVPAPPPPADVAAAVRTRLETPVPVRRRRRRWRLVTAIVLVVIAITAATPQGRAAVAQILRYAGIELSIGGERSTPPATPQPIPGERGSSLQEARKLAKFPIKVPAELGEPTEVRVSDGGRVVSMLWPQGVRLDQYNGQLELVFRKELGPPWPEEVMVGQVRGWWISDKHQLDYLPGDGSKVRLRVAGPTLAWHDGPVGLRLEGVTDLTRALRIANSMR